MPYPIVAVTKGLQLGQLRGQHVEKIAVVADDLFEIFVEPVHYDVVAANEHALTLRGGDGAAR
jgi:hypothetical protein